jgi:hypothetical protein
MEFEEAQAENGEAALYAGEHSVDVSIPCAYRR